MDEGLFEESGSVMLFRQTHRCWRCQEQGFKTCIFESQEDTRCVRCDMAQADCVFNRYGRAENFGWYSLKNSCSYDATGDKTQQMAKLQSEVNMKKCEIVDLTRKLEELKASFTVEASNTMTDGILREQAIQDTSHTALERSQTGASLTPGQHFVPDFSNASPVTHSVKVHAVLPPKDQRLSKRGHERTAFHPNKALKLDPKVSKKSSHSNLSRSVSDSATRESSKPSPVRALVEHVRLPQVSHHTSRSLSEIEYHRVLQNGARAFVVPFEGNIKRFFNVLKEQNETAREDVMVILYADFKTIAKNITRLLRWEREGLYLDALLVEGNVIDQHNRSHLQSISQLIDAGTVKRFAVSVWTEGGANKFSNNLLPSEPLFYQIRLPCNRRSREIVAYCKEKEILIQAVVNVNETYKNSTVESIASQRGVSNHQVLIQFCSQKDNWLICLPIGDGVKMEDLDFQLTAEEMRLLDRWALNEEASEA